MRLFPRAVLAAASCFLAACDICVDPGYDGAATDEALLSLLDAEKSATVDDSKAGLVFAPAPGGELTLSTAPELDWTTGLSARRDPPAKVKASPSFFNELVLGTAWAHGAPMAGPGHLLRLKAPGLACPLSHFTSRTTWTPTGAEWQKLAGLKGKTLTVELISAYFQSNRVTEGPYAPSTPATFQLVP